MSAAAWAQGPTGDAAQAQSLFDRARQLMESGAFADACPLLQESQRLDPAGGTLLNLAICREKEGKLATAYAAYHEALSAAIRDAREDRRKLAQERIDALGPQVSRVVIRVSHEADVPGLIIALDQKTVSRAAWGTPITVDGGPHRIDASAPYRHPWEILIDVKPSGDQRDIGLPVLAPLAPPGAWPYAAAAPPPQQEQKITPGCPSGTMHTDSGCVPYTSRLSGATLTVGAIGIASLLAAGITGVMALVEQSNSHDQLDQAGCLPERQYCKNQDPSQNGVDAQDHARTLGWVSTVTLGVGVVAVGIALLLPRKHVPRTAPSKAPKVGFSF